jgi:hypothetical protein
MAARHEQKMSQGRSAERANAGDFALLLPQPPPV